MDKSELMKALNADDFEPYRKKAMDITRSVHGDIVHIRAILEYSNYCRRRCSYCGLNSTNTKVERYRMADDDIIDIARRGYESGYLTIVLQGGEDPHFDGVRLARIVREISKTGMIVTVSAGELSYDDYLLIKEAGATRYLLKHETSDPNIYQQLHGYMPLSNRLECLRNIKKLGYDTGSGFMIGLPSQTIETIADDIMLLGELNCDMAGIGPFIPHQDTPLSKLPHGSIELTRRAVSLTRICYPHIMLPATTALHVLSVDDARSVFEHGANVIMRKITPSEQRAKYQIYPSMTRDTDIVGERAALEEYIRSMARTPL